MRVGEALDLAQVSDPAPSVAGRSLLYFKSDGLLYSRDSAGTVRQVGAGAAPTNMLTTDTPQNVSAVKTFDAPVIISPDNPLTGTANPSNALTLGSRGGMFSAGALGMWLTDNVFYNGTQWIARNSAPDGLSNLSIGPAGLVYGGLSGAVVAGSPYTPSTRFKITPGGTGTITGTLNVSGALTGGVIVPTGVLPATAATRWVGATVSGPPASGSFIVGDWVMSQNAHIWVCTVAGAPGTWVDVGGVTSVAGRTGAVVLSATDIAATGTPDATTFLRGDNVWASPPAGGGSSGTEYDLTQDWTTTQPVNPATGLTLFTRHRARRMLSIVGPTGMDTALQPALFSNRVAMLTAVPGSASEPVVGFSVARTTAPTALALATTNFTSRLARLRYSTAATVGSGNGVRSGTGTTGVAGYFLSNMANAGGFFFVARFGVGISQAGSRGFIGLCSTLTQFPLAADPSTDTTAKCGFYWNATDTGLNFVARNTATSTASLGTSYPVKTSATDFYEVRMFAPSGSAAAIYWSALRLNTGDFTQGSVTNSIYIPPADTFMAAHVGISNGTTAAIAAIDIQSLYIETDN